MTEGNSSLYADPVERQKRWTAAGTVVAAIVAIGVLVIGRPRST
jgi:hypothetical protein